MGSLPAGLLWALLVIDLWLYAWIGRLTNAERFAKCISKVDDIKKLKRCESSPSYYSALTLRGQALLNLGMTDAAGQTLEELLEMK